jgi:hypothetical protein
MLKNQWSKKEIEDSEYEIHHRALSEEYSFFEAVKDGNIEAVSKNLKEEPLCLLIKGNDNYPFIVEGILKHFFLIIMNQLK